MEENEVQVQTAESMGEVLIRQLSVILEQIDQYRQVAVNNKMVLPMLTERIHRVFTIIDPYLAKEDREKHFELAEKLSDMKLIKTQSIDDNGDLLPQPIQIIDNKKLLIYTVSLDEMEMHLWACLKKGGMGFGEKTRRMG